MTDVDTLVIGSGAGGLAGALALAQAGHKVLVLEQHDVPGGWCHSFTLEGYRFSPGVHYIGELAPGGRMRAVYEGLGVAGDMTFLELNPEGFDHVVIGDEHFSIPKGRQAFADRLKARFPGEAAGIDRYLRNVEKIGKELDILTDVRGLKDAVTLPLRVPTIARYGLGSLSRMLRAHVRDPKLAAVLAIQAGDHAMAPKRAPALLHAAIQAHYFDGGFYPKGGAFTIPRAFVRALKRAGGEVRLSTRVEQILVEGQGRQQRAVGVRLADGTEIRARQVLSNADPGVTYGRLVGPERLPWLQRRRLAKTTWSISSLSLFMAVDMDLRAAGLDSGNLWYAATPDLDHIYESARLSQRAPDDIPGWFLTATTLKDPSKLKKGHHTLEMFSFVGWDAFKKYADTRFGDRPESYGALKRELTDRMLDAADKVVPGLRDRVVFSDLGTPLTNQHYCEATEGSIYGTEKKLSLLGPFAWQIRGPIRDLYLCGASTTAHGVMGATTSGLQAAAAILRCRVGELLRHGGAELTILPAEAPETWPAKLRPRGLAGAPLAAAAGG